MWVAIEGIDGAGKRTQATLLKERIGRTGLRAEVVSFPRYGETVFARSIADYLNGRFGQLRDIDPHLAALLYAGDRAESREMLLRASDAADVLILDRYVASNLAYQAARLPAADRWPFIEWLAEIEHVANRLPKADCTLLLDVPLRTAARLVLHKDPRDYTTAAADLHEQDQAYLAQCGEVYALLAERQFLSDWSVIACATTGGQMLDPETIHAAIWQAVAPALTQQSTPASRPA